jgi:hypothetical protein
MSELSPMNGEETNRRAKASVAIVRMRRDVCIFLISLLNYVSGKGELFAAFQVEIRNH